MGRVGKPGAYVRSLAAKRRFVKALIPVLAAFLMVAPFLVSIIWGNVGIFGYAGCFLAAVWLILQRKKLERRALKADRGASAEEKVSLLLAPLQRRGWQIEHNLKLPDRYSDIDVFLLSPDGKAFAIEVKGHKGRGEIVFDGTQLMIRKGSILMSFPEKKNFLKQATGNARALNKAKSLGWVEAIVVFTDTKVSIQNSDNRVQNVYVVEANALIELLEKLAVSGS